LLPGRPSMTLRTRVVEPRSDQPSSLDRCKGSSLRTDFFSGTAFFPLGGILAFLASAGSEVAKERRVGSWERTASVLCM